jgi:hypothetical protein
MFVRWQSRERRSAAYGRSSAPDVHWAAILVESARVKGKTTQKHIAYLGGIRESAIAIIHQRCWWWDALNKRLDQLGNRISQENRRRIEAAIAKKVRRLSKKQYDQCVRDVREKYGIER